MSAERLAKLANVSERDIQLIEDYKLKPNLPTLTEIARVLHLRLEQLADIQADKWRPNPIKLSSEGMVVDTVSVPYGPYVENCYIIGCKSSSLGAVVDPGGNSDEIIERLSARNLKLDLILITHAHRDHTSGLKQLAESAPNARLICSELECNSIPKPPTLRYMPIIHDDTPALGSLRIRAISTPGHTRGSMCYLVDGVCFVGDTLFAGSIGRPENAEVYAAMLKSIRTRILSLPNDAILFPGHGPATTVGEENAHNPFF